MSQVMPAAREDLPALAASLIRTWTPMLAGWLVSLPLARPVLDLLGWDSDTARRQVAGTLVLAAGVLYYLAVRLAERRWPAAGRLLGCAIPPAYLRVGRQPDGEDLPS